MMGEGIVLRAGAVGILMWVETQIRLVLLYL
jgi:hypothetical protein